MRDDIYKVKIEKTFNNSISYNSLLSYAYLLDIRLSKLHNRLVIFGGVTE